jgi:lipid II:glycine glycyltransferase (peptidoglycan interpeptide bridge formation enzyme)
MSIAALTWTRTLDGRDAEDYDRFVESAAGGHYAQARWWAPVACAGRPFRSSFVLARERDGRVVGAAHVLRAQAGGVPLPAAVIERGPVVDDPARLPSLLAQLSVAARRRGILRLSISPYWDGERAMAVERVLGGLGWRKRQTADGAHAVTLRLSTGDLSDGAPFAGGDFASLRRKISAADKAGARARRGGVADLPALARLHDALMARQGLRRKSTAWVAAVAAAGVEDPGRLGLFLTEHEGVPVAAALMVRHGHLVTYAVGASDSRPSKFSKMVPSFVAAIRWCRELGCDFDLGGVPMAGDDDPKRASIAQFKRDFSQTRVELLGLHTRWLL